MVRSMGYSCDMGDRSLWFLFFVSEIWAWKAAREEVVGMERSSKAINIFWVWLPREKKRPRAIGRNFAKTRRSGMAWGSSYDSLCVLQFFRKGVHRKTSRFGL